MYLANSTGLSRNLFQTSSTAMMTSAPRQLDQLADLLLASLPGDAYGVCGLTTAGTSRTVSAPHSFALSQAGAHALHALLDHRRVGRRKRIVPVIWFITEWTRMPVSLDAARISSARSFSGVVGHSISSKPASLAI